MGGVDKGLQNYHGMPLALHALMRLRPRWAADDQCQPQPGRLRIDGRAGVARSDGRLPRPAGRAGWPAWSTARRPTWSTVPCDTPHFPADLVARLAQALVREDADIAMAATREDGRVQVQPVFCLLKATLLESLVQPTCTPAQRKIDRWTAQHRCVQVRVRRRAGILQRQHAGRTAAPAGAERAAGPCGRGRRRAPSGALGDADGRELGREVLGLVRDLHRHLRAPRAL